MKCRGCKEDHWTMVMARIRIEEGIELDLWQCDNCKRVVVGTGLEEVI